MKKILTASAAAVIASAAVFSISVSADETNFSYTQLSIAFVYVDFDDDIFLSSGNSFEVYSDIGGVSVSGSYQFPNNVVIGASGAYLESSGRFTEINSSQSLWFAGYAFPASQNVDLFFSAGIAYVEDEYCEFGCMSFDDSGIYLAGDVRAWASSWLELNAGISHIDFSDFENDTSLSLGAAGWFNDSSSIFLSISSSDNSTGSVLGYRYTF